MRHQIENWCERISSVAALAVMTLFTLYSTSPERSLCSQIVFSQDSPATTLAEPAVLLQMFRKDGKTRLKIIFPQNPPLELPKNRNVHFGSNWKIFNVPHPSEPRWQRAGGDEMPCQGRHPQFLQVSSSLSSSNTKSNQILNEYLKRSSSNPARPHRTHRLQQQVKGWKVKVETMEVVKVIKSKSDKRKSGKSDKSKSGKSESEKVQS